MVYGYQMVTMTSRDPERLNSWPQYVWSTTAGDAV